MPRPRWRSRFSTLQQVDPQTENSPSCLVAPFNLNDGEFIGNCMIDSSNSTTTCSLQADVLQKVYGKTDHDDVYSDGMKQKKVALVDDCAFDGKEQRPRRSRGPLTAYELYEFLREPRFRDENDNVWTADNTVGAQPPANSTSSPDLAEQDNAQPDADRRIIYITDLDRWSVLALLSTASIPQIGPLRHVLYRHVAPEAYIGISICPHDMFELAFHLPFRAWRPRDAGETAPGAADVSFLDWDGKSPGSLHRAVYSCLVAGSDEWHWVAYCFIDTQFQGSSEDRESAENCFDDIHGPGSLPLDPCGNLKFMNDKIGPNPRRWFLMVLEARLDMIINEWRRIAWHIEQSIERYRQVRAHLLDHLVLSAASPAPQCRVKYLAWAERVQQPCTDLSGNIGTRMRVAINRERFQQGPRMDESYPDPDTGTLLRHSEGIGCMPPIPEQPRGRV